MKKIISIFLFLAIVSLLIVSLFETHIFQGFNNSSSESRTIRGASLDQLIMVRSCYNETKWRGGMKELETGCSNDEYTTKMLPDNTTILSLESKNKLKNRIKDGNATLEEISDLDCLGLWWGDKNIFSGPGKIKDLSGLQNLSNLKVLNIYGSQLKNLSGIGELKQLEELYICEAPLEDVSLICNLTNLKIFEIQNTRVSDISCVRNFKDMRFLLITDNPNLSNFTFMREFPKLKFTDIRSTNVTHEEVQNLRKDPPNTKILAPIESKLEKQISASKTEDDRIKERLEDFGYLKI